MHKVFISYHHDRDQLFKNKLVRLNKRHDLFVDRSVKTGDIPDDWSDQQIRQEIRDHYLRDSTVTILLVGSKTKNRDHVDWEIYSSMYDGLINKRSGIVAINLPATLSVAINLPETLSKSVHVPLIRRRAINGRSGYEKLYPFMPSRIIDNLIKPDVKIPVVPWNKINPDSLELLIEFAYRNRKNNCYDLSRKMRRSNSLSRKMRRSNS